MRAGERERDGWMDGWKGGKRESVMKCRVCSSVYGRADEGRNRR